MTTVKDVLDLRDKISDIKEKKSRLEGRRDAAKKQLKEAGCKNVAEAKTKLTKLKKQTDRHQKELNKKLAMAEEEYGDLL